MIHRLTGKLTCLLLAVVLCAALAAPAAALGAYVLCSVTPTPTTAGSVGAYTIRLTDNPYEGIDELRITFPYDSGMTSASFPSSSVTINGVSSKGGQITKVASTNEIRLDVMLSQRLVTGQPVTIVVAQSAGIVNAVSPRSCYRLRVSFLQNFFEIDSVDSDLYAITPSAIGSLTVSVEPAIVGAPAAISANFIVGANGTMKTSQDNIRIKFPGGFSLPASFGLAGVTVNGVVCNGKVFRDNNDASVVLIYVPFDVRPGSLISADFPATAGVTCPLTPGTGIFSVSTSAEPTWIDSAPLTIRGREVSNLNVTLTNNVAGSATGIQVAFRLSPVGRLQQGARLYVRLPGEFGIPTLTAGATVLLNYQQAAVAVQNGVVVITSPTYLIDGADVNIVVLQTLGFTAPRQSRGYTVGVWTDGDGVETTTTFVVTAPSLSALSLTPSTRAIGRVAAWDVALTPSSVAAFPAAGEHVVLAFDDQILVPAMLGKDSAQVDGHPASAVATGQTVTVTVPDGVSVGSTLHVTLTEAAGIRTPAVPATCGVRASTTRDSNPIASSAVEFRSLPVATIQVTPDVPNGLGGRYIATKPTVRLVNEESSLYYRIDQGAYQPYSPGTSIAIDEGSHTLTAYAVARDGTQGEPSSRSFVVDLTKPVVTLAGDTGDLLIRSTSVTITGSVSEPVDVLQFNGIAAVVAADLTYSVALNVSDGQALACFARDLAGNSITFVRTVRVDTTAPAITRQGPSPAESTVHVDSISVRVTVSEPASVTVNGIPMTLTGSVWEAMVPLVKGENAITVTAVDRVGNENRLTWTVTRNDVFTIQLVLGQMTARVGDATVELEVPASIIGGSTFVPLRFVGEALGAKVEWNGDLQVILLSRGTSQVQLSIGSRMAIVDGQIVELKDVPPPIIVKGRTLVPVRFISEAFGAQVSWNAATQTVTIAASAAQ